ncbi:hypothetical protein SDC9_93470 [bioreactor metagenome]|uniref:Uncharacterized protein n=1 Tax=bioreactor metagenome TaxID=1076179 RepID=A0A645AAQ6_9ZZZZ
MQRPGLAEAGDEDLAAVEHLLNLVGRDRQFVGVFGPHICGADDRHGVHRHQDVAVGGVGAAVDHGVHQAVIHRDHDAAARHDLDIVAAGHLGDVM